MPRISYVEPQTASAEVQQLYEHRLGGKPGNVHKIMAHQPKALTAFIAFYASVGRSLDRRLYELVYIRTSILNQCNY
jgi:alkylhydroperoxidase family enzyme